MQARKALNHEDQEPAHLDDEPVRAAKQSIEPNRYAITLAALVASAQVPLTEQIQEQPTAAFHDYSVGSTPPQPISTTAMATAGSTLPPQ